LLLPSVPFFVTKLLLGLKLSRATAHVPRVFCNYCLLRCFTAYEKLRT
jgi:hypothetical protein